MANIPAISAKSRQTNKVPLVQWEKFSNVVCQHMYNVREKMLAGDSIDDFHKESLAIIMDQEENLYKSLFDHGKEHSSLFFGSDLPQEVADEVDYKHNMIRRELKDIMDGNIKEINATQIHYRKKGCAHYHRISVEEQ